MAHDSRVGVVPWTGDRDTGRDRDTPPPAASDIRGPPLSGNRGQRGAHRRAHGLPDRCGAGISRLCATAPIRGRGVCGGFDRHLDPA